MIGPQLRKALIWAAVVYMLFGPASTLIQLYETSSRPDFEILGSSTQFWIGSLAALVATVVQGGVLLVLLSIDKNLMLRREN